MKALSRNQPVVGEEHYDFAIIGMGIGGLTIGALLAHAGRKVIIFEQHYVPRGIWSYLSAGAVFVLC